jgi:hypothetical protein
MVHVKETEINFNRWERKKTDESGHSVEKKRGENERQWPKECNMFYKKSYSFIHSTSNEDWELKENKKKEIQLPIPTNHNHQKVIELGKEKTMRCK